MALINVTPKAVTRQAYQLTSATEMLTALDYLKTRGYSGSVNCYKSNGVGTYQMTLQSDSGNGTQQIGAIGDWVVIENDTIANVIPAAKAALLYQVS